MLVTRQLSKHMEQETFLSTREKYMAYIQKGIKNIEDTDNAGYLPAFPSNFMNEKGFPFDKNTLTEVLDETISSLNIQDFPENFIVKVKKSSLALFKHWLVEVSNRELLPIIERSHAFHKMYFFMFLPTGLTLIPLTSNTAHELFLLNVYNRKKVNQYEYSFKTSATAEHKLIIYKDYANKKISTVKLKKSGMRKEQRFDISVLREDNNLKFKINVDDKYLLNHSISFKRSARVAVAGNKAKKNLEAHLQEVIDIVKKHAEAPCKTNNSANISLGRVRSIPILLTLPGKGLYKNTEIQLSFREKDKLVQVHDLKGTLIKTMVLAFPPKSNWLKKTRLAPSA